MIRRENVKIVVIVITLFMVVLVVLDFFEPKSALPTLAAALEKITYMESDAVVTIKTPRLEIAKLRDPLQIPVATRKQLFAKKPGQKQQLANVQLQGIVWNPQGESKAIVNGKIFTIGDFVEGIQIIEINKDNVKLIYQENEVSLTLK